MKMRTLLRTTLIMIITSVVTMITVTVMVVRSSLPPRAAGIGSNVHKTRHN